MNTLNCKYCGKQLKLEHLLHGFKVFHCKNCNNSNVNVICKFDRFYNNSLIICELENDTYKVGMYYPEEETIIYELPSGRRLFEINGILDINPNNFKHRINMLVMFQ